MPKHLSQNANLCLVLIQLPSQKLYNYLFTSKALRRVALASDLHNDIILIHHRNVLVHQQNVLIYHLNDRFIIDCMFKHHILDQTVIHI